MKIRQFNSSLPFLLPSSSGWLLRFDRDYEKITTFVTMKTIKEWLETLPEPYRSKALSQADTRSLKEKCRTLALAISGSISWRGSVEGIEYWIDVYRRAMRGDFDKKQEQPTICLKYEGHIAGYDYCSITRTWFPQRKAQEQMNMEQCVCLCELRLAQEENRKRMEMSAERRKQLEHEIVHLMIARNILINRCQYEYAKHLRDVERMLRDELSRLS